MPRVEELPLIRDWTIVQGSTFRRRWIYKPGGVPMLFEGWTALWQARDTRGALLAEATTQPGDGVFLGLATGVVDFTLSEDKTRSVTRDGVHALELIGPGETIPLIRGRVRHMVEVAL